MQTAPEFDKKVTQISQVEPRLKKLFPDKDIVCYRNGNSGDIFLVTADLDVNGNPYIKRATHYCYRLYNVSLESWNEGLRHIHNDFIFPGDLRFACYNCRCPDMDLITTGAICKNCKENYDWKAVEK